MAHADKILRNLLDEIIKELNYDDHEVIIKPITSGGANYTSTLYLITLKKDDEEIQLFAKVACIGEKLRATINATKLYKTEWFAYSKLAKIYNDLQDKHEISNEDRFKFPKFYGCSTKICEETIVLENLVTEGYVSYDRFKSIDLEHANSALESLAKFHALSFAYQKENPEEFNKVVEEYAFEAQRRDSGVMRQVWKKMVDSSLGHLTDELRDRTQIFVDKFGDESWFEKYCQPLSNPVLIHGDYRPSNMLFRKPDGKTETMVVDYQTIRSGCPVADLIYFIFMGTDAKFRADHYDHLIEHYYLQLSFAMARLGVDATEVYPREVYDSDLKEMLGFGVLLAVAVLPVVLVEAENAPRVDGEADPTNWVIKPNDLYAERFTGIIADCARWGVI